jgi:hypothetical protein
MNYFLTYARMVAASERKSCSRGATQRMNLIIT